VSANDDDIHEALKPRWRGLLHFIFVFVSLAAGAVLLLVASSPRAAWAGLVYCLSLVGMYTISSTYHRRTWSDRGRERMRRLDHAGIFLLIAGTYTPVAALGIPGWQGTALLWAAWIGAALGVVHSLFFVNAFRKLNAVLYVAYGCMALPVLPTVIAGMGAMRTALIVAGGAVYITGAFVYGRKWPNPSATVFGYHEVFHAMVVVGSALHFATILSLVQQVPAPV
jgi:hemolysin III